eukprot:XP_011682276.1 PREDICTED: multidrug resistance-associated protein 5 [Strongylocentrotus purpuratus]
MMNIIRICGDVFFWVFSCRTATRLRSGALALAFRRLAYLRSLQDWSVGEIVNVCANDSQRLFDACVIGNFLISSLVMLVAATIATYLIIGPGALIGTVITFSLFFPLQMILGRAVSMIRIRCIRVTDERVKKMNEILSYIKLIKMYAWEKPFMKTIAGIRAVERRLLEKAGLIQSYSISIIPVVPSLASVSSILIHVAMGNTLSASEAFTLVALLNVMRVVIGPTPFAVRMVAEGSVALRRLKAIIILERIEPNPRLEDTSDIMVEIREGTFGWDVVQRDKKTGKKNDQKDTHIPTEREQISQEDKYHEDDIMSNTCLTNGVRLTTLPSGVIYDSSKISPTLYSINLQLKKGEITGVCGLVGSGKSSLLSAILGQMHTLEGVCQVAGQFAYVAQEAWIFNASVKENILFGEEMDEERYRMVISACSLGPDRDVLRDGDETEIGERGVNLSGGQKQRISLARAVYADRDVYLLDDPLSAVDTHVGRHIFTDCIMGTLRDKTRLPHQLQYLQACDTILVMSNGRIAEQGPHDDLISEGGEYARFITAHNIKDGETREGATNLETNKQHVMRHISEVQSLPGDLDGQSESSIHERDEDSPLSAELTSTRGPGWHTYHAYVESMGGYLNATGLFLSFIVLVGLLVFNNWWLGYWIQTSNSSQGNSSGLEGDEMSLSEDANLGFYALVYAVSLAVVFVVAGLKSLIYMKLTMRSSSTLHNRLFERVVRSPMRFFDTTPTGHILNRFSKDMDEVDVMLPVNVDIAVMNTMVIIASIVSISAVFYYFMIVIIPVCIVSYFIFVFYRRGVNDLKRLENSSRSPWFSHIGSTTMGLSTIHAYDKTEEVIAKFLDLLDMNAYPLMLFRMAMRWAGARLELLVLVIITITNLMVVLKHGSVPPTLAGLAISYAMQLTGLFQFTMSMVADAEARFLSAERILQYTKLLESEAPDETTEKPDKQWPSQGAIKFNNFKMRYRDNLPLVLKSITCNIQAGQKIGIVGRTGSGKSSLGVALFRLLEAVEGSIFIDGVDISKVGLTHLRSKLSIIPQDPVLFIGTIRCMHIFLFVLFTYYTYVKILLNFLLSNIQGSGFISQKINRFSLTSFLRYNLDPFREHEDEALWQVLDKVYMQEKISSLTHGLESLVTEGGDNFSVGEKQLLCMARVLLRNSKILFLDEATAAIDTETDSLIQQTIRTAFNDCTTLTIAHRLNTVLDSDKILVMDDGKIVEFDSPSVLLSDPTSIFSKMVLPAESQNE